MLSSSMQHLSSIVYGRLIYFWIVVSSSMKWLFKSSVCSSNQFLFSASSSSEQGAEACMKSGYLSETVSKQICLEGCSSGSCNVEQLAMDSGPRSSGEIMPFSLQLTGISLVM